MIERIVEFLNRLLGVGRREDARGETKRDKAERRSGAAIMELARNANATWGTLSSLAAHATDAGRLYAVTDQDSPPVRIVEIALGANSPHVVREIPISAPDHTELDCEGLAIVPQGGFWLASEGAAGNTPANLLIEVDGSGRQLRTIELPLEIAQRMGRQGFEGVAYVGSRPQDAVLVVTFQASVDGDREGVARIGVVDLRDEGWTFHHYPLEQLPSGKYSGLSDITHIGGSRFALIERDGEKGKHALKWVTVVELDIHAGAAPDDEPPLLAKRVVMDLAPFFREQGYKVEPEIEGLAITADKRVYAITDNDNKRPTLLLNLGRADELFAA